MNRLLITSENNLAGNVLLKLTQNTYHIFLLSIQNISTEYMLITCLLLESLLLLQGIQY